MATTPTGSPKPRKALLLVAAAGLAVVAYLFLRPKTPAAAAPSGDSGGGVVPQTSSSGDSSQQQSSADLLASLAGENQQLMKSFLASNSGLVSLAGSSVGAATGSASTPAGEPAANPGGPFVPGGGGFSTSTSGGEPVALSTVTPVAPPATDVSLTSTLTEPPPQQPLYTGTLPGDLFSGGGAPPFASSGFISDIAAGVGNLSGSAPGGLVSSGFISDISAAAANPAAGSLNEQAFASPNQWGTYQFPTTTAPSVTVTQSKPGSGNLAA